ncbi:MAG TPA: acyl-CoA desaturase, partial [Bdellovibrionota bacterium]|nr:acyl-CoA desaturase [Bdellovibrionota bacterium]
MTRKYDWVGSIPFFAVHVWALVGAFFVHWTWGGILLCLGLYFLRMFGITAGYHRYFSHRTYRMGRIFQFVMAWLGSSAVQKGVIFWSAHHRHHHKYSDLPGDVHSPVQDGFWYSHVGWILDEANSETRSELVKDLTGFPELVWLNKWHLVPGISLAVLLTLLGGWPALYFGFVLSTVLLWHGTFT